MLGNHYILREVARDLAAKLRGIAITELYTQEKDELALSLAQTPGALILSCRRESNCCFLHSSFTRSRRNSVDIFPSCAGATISDLSVHPGDRVLVIHLVDEREIIARFFGGQANVLLAGRGTVIAAFKDHARLAGTPCVPPPPPSPVDLTLLESIAQSSALPSDAVRKTLPALGPVLAREVTARAAIADTPGPHPESSVLSLQQALLRLLEELEHPRPVLYRPASGGPPLLSPVRLMSQADATAEEVVDLHAAIRHVLYARRAGSSFARRKALLLEHLQKQLDRIQRSMEAIQHDLEHQSRPEEYERSGRLLLEHLASIPKGAASVPLPADEAPAVIALDPRLTPSQNAQRYFEKAKRSRTARTEAAERRAMLDERSGRARELIAGLSGLDGPEAFTAFVKEHTSAMEEFGIGEKGEPRDAPLFRVFVVEGGFEVWAGKSSENNDLLTLRHARPNDLWFHARGASGSHVILRVGSAAGTPGKRAKEQAAGIAAYYSKMKTARLVPVAMTERKYVRKPRGAKAGTVAIEREQVIFAVPQLPPPTDAPGRASGGR